MRINYAELPVYKQKDKILEALAKNQVIVVESPTGSGKTTQIPQLLYQAGYANKGVIGVTQPRRIAAVSVSEYIAKQLGKKIPDTVGYKMRFLDKTDPTTKIKIMTDGTLLQEIKADYYLSQYSVIMVDEAHERSLNIDFILGLLKRVLAARTDFKVIISSATINPESFSVYFDGCPMVNIESSMYDVDIQYQPVEPEGDYDALIDRIANLTEQYVKTEKEGDVLVFLPGEKPIKDTASALLHSKIAAELEILPLYARLSSEEQERVFEDYPGKRKVIIATNIAETSITIDGVALVIDSGLAKINYYSPLTFTSSLVETPISKAAAKQRRGRAGRTRPGVCYRLYSRQDYEHRPLYTTEEIMRTDLSEVVLRMAEINIKDFENFEFLTPPEPAGIIGAVDTLRLLGAIDEKRDLTETGKMMTLFPLSPRHSRIIVEAIHRYPRVLDEILTATAFLTTNSPLLLPQGQEMEARKAHHSFRHALGDFISYLNIYKAYSEARDRERFCNGFYLDKKVMDEILNVKQQLAEIVSEQRIPILSGGDYGDYLSAVARGHIQFVCVRAGRGLYHTLTAAKVQIHPSSVMWGKEPEYMVAGEIVRTTRLYARSVSLLREEWLKQISPTLLGDLKARKSGRTAPARAEAEKRDFTNQIKIGSETFKVTHVKGRKIVTIPAEAVKGLAEKAPPDYIAALRDLRGEIQFGKYKLLNGARLPSLLNLAPLIDFSSGVLDDWPAHRNFTLPQNKRVLLDTLDLLLRPTSRKKHDKYLGFLCLNSDGKGTYWFTAEKNFTNAVSTSLSGLEGLADEPEGNLEHGDIAHVNRVYRKLDGMMGK
jgi:ATP-dependent helicase HrpA